ncbi:hypothetical protein [Chondromyces crocatus]|nr:hypothetical protein [Chondromyces crocatus]
MAASAQAMGCFPLDFSEGDVGGTGGGGAGGYEPPACPGDPVTDPALVRDDCGTFVSASAADGGDGTKAKPFKSLAEAATKGAKRIYACAESYSAGAETVMFTGGVDIFAGFTDCGATGAWTWAEGSKATLSGPADLVALTLNGGDYLVRNLNVTAANAQAPGGSSIAVVVTGGTLHALNSEFRGGNAQNGADGAPQADDPDLDGNDGGAGSGVCLSAAENPGAVAPVKVCTDAPSSTGGKGGDGGVLVGGAPQVAGSGEDGLPEPVDPDPPNLGDGGVGEGVNGASSCRNGEPGADGESGTNGGGVSGRGSVSLTGYTGVDGASGLGGQPGHGGGGGGAARGAQNITCNGVTISRVGSSGGAGGTGGCGGAGGHGGKAGGSSIALLVLDATVTLEGTTVTAGRAGHGGKGGEGQRGGQPGQGGGNGAGQGAARQSCRGGDGGLGGRGGHGGGGTGGHALGIAVDGDASVTGATFVMDAAVAGDGGLGAGTAPDNGSDGAGGQVQNCWDFGKDSACSG